MQNKINNNNYNRLEISINKNIIKIFSKIIKQKYNSEVILIKYNNNNSSKYFMGYNVFL
jgi:hypothetical protein